MRKSHGKTRSPLPFGMNFGNNDASDPSKGNQLNVPNDTTFVSYSPSETTTASQFSSASQDLDVSTLNDDEVRERFKAVMVGIFLNF